MFIHVATNCYIVVLSISDKYFFLPEWMNSSSGICSLKISKKFSKTLIKIVIIRNSFKEMQKIFRSRKIIFDIKLI